MGRTPSEATAGLLSLRSISDQYDLSPEKIRAAVKTGWLKGHQVGRSLFIERPALEAWIKSGGLTSRRGTKDSTDAD